MPAASRHSVRRLRGFLCEGLCVASAALVLLILAAVLLEILVNGARAINLNFFLQLPAPVGRAGGGMGNALVGSLLILAVAAAISVPVGVLTGVYLAEFGDNRFGTMVRFLADVLSGIPSIVVGLIAYLVIVVPMQRFSAVAGGAALAVLLLPTIIRTTEAIVRMVPGSLREASLALGAPRWRTILQVVLPTASGGIATGALLAIARGAGETAPLFFTAFGNSFWNVSLVNPIAAVPLQIYTDAISPSDAWHAQAWAGALVLVLLILVMSVAVRITTRIRGLGRG